MKRYYIFLMLTISALSLSAQNTDSGLWTEAGIEKGISKKWDLNVTAEYRSREKITTVDQIRGAAMISYRINKYVKLGAGYMLIADKKQKKDIFEYRSRFITQATGSYKFGRFTASLRPRLQVTFLEGNGQKDSWVLRNRLGLKYNIPKIPLNPYTNFEMYHELSGNSDISGKTRFGIGVEFKPAKAHCIDFGFKFNRKTVKSKRQKANIVCIGYTYSF